MKTEDEVRQLKQYIKKLEVAAVKAVLPLEAYRLAGGRVHCDEIEEAINEGIQEVRQVLTSDDRVKVR